MRVVTSETGEKKLVMDRSEWERVGKHNGWFKRAQMQDARERLVDHCCELAEELEVGDPASCRRALHDSGDLEECARDFCKLCADAFAHRVCTAETLAEACVRCCAARAELEDTIDEDEEDTVLSKKKPGLGRGPCGGGQARGRDGGGCPGGRKRSKGKGRGLGTGRGRGPIGVPRGSQKD